MMTKGRGAMSDELKVGDWVRRRSWSGGDEAGQVLDIRVFNNERQCKVRWSGGGGSGWYREANIKHEDDSIAAAVECKVAELGAISPALADNFGGTPEHHARGAEVLPSRLSAANGFTDDHYARVADLTALVAFLELQPRIAAAVTGITAMFYSDIGVEAVVAISEAMGARPRQSPAPSDMWIDRAFGGVKLHVVVPKAACGKAVTAFKLDERLRPTDPSTTAIDQSDRVCTCGHRHAVHSALRAGVVCYGQGGCECKEFAANDWSARIEPPEVAAVLTPDAAQLRPPICPTCGHDYPGCVVTGCGCKDAWHNIDILPLDVADAAAMTQCEVVDPDGYICTEPVGHYGDHLAGTGDGIASRWPNTDNDSDYELSKAIIEGTTVDRSAPTPDAIADDCFRRDQAALGIWTPGQPKQRPVAATHDHDERGWTPPE
jgi:hypothetical protein